MKIIIYLFVLALLPFGAKATIHVIQVWDGYMEFLPYSLEVELGDTIQWLPLDNPTMVHTVTSSNIPNGAVEFDVIWQAPADTFFQYVPCCCWIIRICLHTTYSNGNDRVFQCSSGICRNY